MFDDFYDNSSEIEALTEEFKDSLLKSVKEEFLNEMDRLRKENVELKRMLKIAVEDIYNRSYCGMCENGIPIDNDVCDRCKAITLDMFEWRHKAEAMKLIGEEK